MSRSFSGGHLAARRFERHASPRRSLALGTQRATHARFELLEERRLLALVPELVADVNRGTSFVDVIQSAAIGDVAIFVTDDGRHGTELWRTDGTSAGTYLLRDVNPDGSADPVVWTEFGGQLYFVADDGEHGRELWRTDGTTEGTALFLDVNPGPAGAFQEEYTGDFAASDAVLYFTASDGSDATQLWKSDGTAAGTTLVRVFEHPATPGDDIPDIGSIHDLTIAGDLLYFTHNDGDGLGTELWKSDGTLGGTAMVKDISLTIGEDRTFGSYPRELTAIGSRLFFTAFTYSDGRELWTSDGTCDGTVSLTDVAGEFEEGGPENLTAFDDTLYFSVPPSHANFGLWMSDGTPGGTALVKDISFSRSYSIETPWQNEFAVVKGALFFVTNGDVAMSERLLWRSDGTAYGTVVVTEFLISPNENHPPLLYDLTAVGDKLYFTVADNEFGHELWLSDGTQEGTRLVKDIRPGLEPSNPLHLVPVGLRLFFSALGSNLGREFFVTDGTEVGTTEILSADRRARGSSPRQITRAGDSIFFIANDGERGREIWRTDGTGQGTTITRDIAPGPESAIDRQRLNTSGPLTGVHNVAYFVVWDPEFGYALWRTDGTESGTQRFFDVSDDQSGGVAGLLNIGEALLFTADEYDPAISAHVPYVWSIPDALEEPTKLGRVVYPLITPREHGVAFVSNAEPSGITEVTLSDGTFDGTHRVVVPGLRSNQIREFIAIGDKLYFAEDNGSIEMRLFVFDLHAESLQLVHELALPRFERGEYDFTDVNGTLFFTLPTGEVFNEGYALWKSDGTAEGTVLVKEFPTGSWEDYPVEFTSVGDTLYFVVGDEEHGDELWKSDGTAAGTVMVADIAPDSMSSFPTNLTNIHGTLFFSANDAEHGFELWHSDGTAEGTVMVAEMRSGGGPFGSAYPHDLVDIGGALYFGARDDLYGDELWRLVPSPGDTNFDDVVDLIDLNNVRNNFGYVGTERPGDVTGDGVVDLDDLNEVRNQFGSEEPGARSEEGEAGSQKSAGARTRQEPGARSQEGETAAKNRPALPKGTSAVSPRALDAIAHLMASAADSMPASLTPRMAKRGFARVLPGY